MTNHRNRLKRHLTDLMCGPEFFLCPVCEAVARIMKYPSAPPMSDEAAKDPQVGKDWNSNSLGLLQYSVVITHANVANSVQTFQHYKAVKCKNVNDTHMFISHDDYICVYSYIMFHLYTGSFEVFLCFQVLFLRYVRLTAVSCVRVQLRGTCCVYWENYQNVKQGAIWRVVVIV